MSVLSDQQTHRVADQIYTFMDAWRHAENRGLCDGEGGSEWRHALARFMLLSDEDRQKWVDQGLMGRVHNVHLLEEVI